MGEPDTPRRRRRLLRWLWVAAALAALGLPAAGLFIVPRLDRIDREFGIEGDAGAADGAGGAIRLLGVVPDESDDLLDPEGRPIGRMLGPQETYRGHWGDTWLRRTLVFELAETDEPLVLSEFVVTIPGTDEEPPREDIHRWDGFLGPSGRRMFVLDFFERAFEFRHPWFGSSRHEYEHLTVTVRYHYGVPDDPLAAFEGPFEVDRAETRRPGNATVTLTPLGERQGHGRGSARFHLLATGAVDLKMTVTAVDGDGRAHPAGSWQGSLGSGGADVRFGFMGLPLAEVREVLVAGRLRERTFRNIRVRYPDRPARTYAPYLDRMAEALALEGMAPKALARYQLKDVGEAIQALGVVRGNHLHRALRLLIKAHRNGQLKSLDAKGREALRADAASLLEAVNPKTRLQAIELGMAMGPWPEFVDPALAVLDEPHRGRRHDAAQLLERYRVQLNPGQLGRVAEKLREAPDIFMFSPLRRLLAEQKTPESTAALKELAADDRPWVWMAAIDALAERKALGPSEDWSDRMWWRVAIARGPDRVGDDPPTLAAARRHLTDLLASPFLLRMYDGGWQRVMKQVVADLPREEAVDAMIEFLRSAEDAGRVGYGVRWIARQINAWHGTDLGRIGADLSRKGYHQPGCSETSLLRDVLLWHETGVDPGAIPPDYRPEPEDLASSG